MPYRRYLAAFLFSLAVFAGAVVAFNCIVDPFGVEAFSWHLSVHRPDLPSYNRFYKAARLRRVHPRTIILGTSRTEFGIDPAHRALRDAAPVLNMALNGITFSEMKEIVRCAAAEGTRRAIVGVDFYNFNIYHELAPNPEPFRCKLTTLDSLKVYATFDALKASAHAVATTALMAARHQPWRAQPIAPDGLENGPVRFDKMLATMGAHNLFLVSERDYLAQGYRFYPAWSFSFQNAKGDSTIERFRSVVALARQEHVQLVLFFSPSHARDWETIRAAGLWNEFETLKREIVRILEEDHGKHPQEPAFVLWDFSGYNTFTTEDVPPLGDFTPMRWYWESAHYKKELGDVVLDRMFTNRATSDFGVVIDVSNVEARIREVREEQRRYHVTHAADVREIDDLARTVAVRH
jgi:hypothetical protein